MKKRVVIKGLGCVTPIGNGKNNFLNSIKNYTKGRCRYNGSWWKRSTNN